MDEREEAFSTIADGQLLKLVLTTIYRDPEIFLRELLANASDAIAKHRNIKESCHEEVEPQPFVRIIPDKRNNTLTIIDNGIGMTKCDLINSLGTIARRSSFLDIQPPEVSLIGLFGLGFYSAFLVGRKVIVTSKHEEDEAYVWEADIDKGTFTVKRDTSTPPADYLQLKRGTRVEIHLEESQREFLEERRLRAVVKKHCLFLSCPIQLQVERKTGWGPFGGEEEEDPNMSPWKKEWAHLNRNPQILTQRPADLTKEQYDTFYKSFTEDFEAPLAFTHLKVEGQLEYTVLLFIPKRAPFELYQAGSGLRTQQQTSNAVKLFLQGVGVADVNEDHDFVPEWLGFIKGLVFADDLPLSISRNKIMQDTGIIRIIRRFVVRAMIRLLTEIMESKSGDDYLLYMTYASNIKRGVISEVGPNQEQLKNLLRFSSNRTGFDPFDMTSLAAYVERMKEGQREIYYVVGESTEEVKRSPFLERMAMEGYEVLLLTDAIDDTLVDEGLKDYEGFKLVDISKYSENMLFGESTISEKKEGEARGFEGWIVPLLRLLHKILEKEVSRVVRSNRLVESPCAVATDRDSMSANHERILRAYPLRDVTCAFARNPVAKVVEVNTGHPIITKLGRLLEDEERQDREEIISRVAWLLYYSALPSSGFIVHDPHPFIEDVHSILSLSLGQHSGFLFCK